VLKRKGVLGRHSSISVSDIDAILDVLCAKALLVSPPFRFRPFLDDPKDNLYIECALAAGATQIVSRDRHFQHTAVAAFGLRVVSPPDFASNLRTEKYS
jgi:predicted nucleic acid-binding protein